MNQSQYAKRIGVSRAQIHKLVKTGVIPLRDGQIDPDEADQILIATRHPSYDHNRKARLPLEGDDEIPLFLNGTPDDGSPPHDLPRGPGVHPVTVPFHQSRAVKEYYFALTAKLEFEEKSGNLVDAKKVEEQAFDTGRNYRDTLSNVPAKWAGEMAAALGLDATTGQEQVHLFLTKIMDRTLAEFADGPGLSGHFPEGGRNGFAETNEPA